LAGGVPEAVTSTLRIQPGLNIAGQFDRPYLLDDSAANVARVLGELTNVSTLFDAVREANRRRAAAAATLRTREADLAELIESSRSYAGLADRLAACQAAEEHAEAAAQLQDRVTRLSAALGALSVAEGVLARTTVPQVPDDSAVQHAAAKLDRLRTLLDEHQRQTRAIKSAQAACTAAVRQAEDLDAELHAALVAAGTCPTCGQPVTAA
jgi:rRNA maturation endonuclease Nob1